MNPPTPRTRRAPAREHVREVLSAPRGGRFNRARPYAPLRTPTQPDRPASITASAPGPAERGALPPWLHRLHAELAPDIARTADVAGRTRPHPSPPRPPAPRPAADTPRRPPFLLRHAGTGDIAYHCTVIGMFLLSHLLGLLG
ncbi:hypothetical protein [Nocardiopsis composta]|uniref:Uncharacterized protein n=1 Tax=Nocardiopsis composta TaxID=157465 RepID=A0A7W8VDK7_9ACTN|nr:hypothetical protein [Nocardiopsis composta]MBB5432357.1 hypothetical protein [Nocardiopsis composta]